MCRLPVSGKPPTCNACRLGLGPDVKRHRSAKAPAHLIDSGCLLARCRCQAILREEGVHSESM
eukprot:10806209-Alexandrium_andersonii.AAC.1